MSDQEDGQSSENGESAGNPKMIMAILQRGRADRAVKAAIRAGAQAATVFFGRGLGIRERLGLLGLAIQPEKRNHSNRRRRAVRGPDYRGDGQRRQNRPTGRRIPLRHASGSSRRPARGRGNCEGISRGLRGLSSTVPLPSDSEWLFLPSFLRLPTDGIVSDLPRGPRSIL